MAYAGKRTKRHPVRRFFKWFFLILLISIIIGAAGILFYVRNVISSAPELDLNLIIPSQSSTYIYNQDGERVQKLTLPESNRDLVSIDRIPVHLQHAFVAIEDSRFYDHNGIDVKGIIRAFATGLKSGSFSEGASTITQQLLKNSIFTDWTTETSFDERLRRKIQEQYLAVKLEELLTKEQILEDYLNVINLGSGCYGIQSASYKYFGKDVSMLTLSESAVIAAITQNPSRYNPQTRPEDNKRRMKAVLDRMLDQGYIPASEYQAALEDDVYSRIQSGNTAQEEYSSVYTYYQDALIDQVLEDLINEKGYTRQQAYKAVYSGGLRIYSAQDDAIQDACDRAFADSSNFPAATMYGIDYALSIEHADGEVSHYGNVHLRSYIRKNGDPSFNLMFRTAGEATEAAERFRNAAVLDDDKVLGERITITPQPQASVVILDQTTGLVKAIVGGRGSKEASLTLNRATYTTRQPGSTFKILTTYAPALDTGGKTLATMYDSSDYPISDGNVISNWDSEGSSGAVSIRDAIIQSVNTAAVRCIIDITPIVGFTCARSFGISTLVDHYEKDGAILSDVVPSLALGGITNGVTVLELCSAYGTIANDGTYVAPKFYTKVTNRYDEILLDHKNSEIRNVIKASTASLLTDAMRDVISSPGGTAYNEIDLGEMDAAGKTGTTSSYRDIWFAGYTPYYTCCVWGGYDNNDVLPEDDIGHTYQKKLWNAIMNEVHKDLPARKFVMSSDIQTVRVCAETGEAASRRCPVKEELFAGDNLPAHYCSVHGDGSLYAPAAASSHAGNASSQTGNGTSQAGNASSQAGNDSGPSGNAASAPDSSAASQKENVPAGNAAGQSGNAKAKDPSGADNNLVDINSGTAWDSPDGWTIYYDSNSGNIDITDPAAGTLEGAVRDDAEAGLQYEGDTWDSYDASGYENENYENNDYGNNDYENGYDENAYIENENYDNNVNGITIYSSDEAVLLPDQADQNFNEGTWQRNDNAVAIG